MTSNSHHLLTHWLACLLLFFAHSLPADESELPVLYRGRYRPLEVYGKLWLQEMTQSSKIPPAIKEEGWTAQDLLWRLHREGSLPIQDTSFITVKNPALKQEMNLNKNTNIFSINELKNLENPSKTTAPLYHAIQSLLSLKGTDLALEKELEEEFNKALKAGVSGKVLQRELEIRHPLRQRLFAAGDELRVLPMKDGEGEWLSLKALLVKVYDPVLNRLVPIGNFTSYPDEDFEKIRTAYRTFLNSGSQTERSELIRQLGESYQKIQSTAYRSSPSRILTYPSIRQLQAEALYYRFPFTFLTIALYSLAALFFVLSTRRSSFFSGGIISLIAAFSIHTALLGLRCYILSRPPVSNMFETVLYVPWIAVAVSLGFLIKFRTPLLPSLASLSAIVLLIILHISDLDGSMENVQAVLDSRYWLTVHVLMIVASYGVFSLCALIGHCSLYLFARGRSEPEQSNLTPLLIQTTYLGTALLIPATILGGVWAAQSWGRFWDWDPKESWAFISSCIYLIVIHLYRFHLIGLRGLAAGSIIGMMAISFTWYGVNYILGTGLHSYGFGSGGEKWYYLYLLAELVFLSLTLFVSRNISTGDCDLISS